jgi:hypothetical protein
MALTRRDMAYLLALVWSFIGIALKQAGAQLVMVGAWAAAVAALGWWGRRIRTL